MLFNDFFRGFGIEGIEENEGIGEIEWFRRVKFQAPRIPSFHFSLFVINIRLFSAAKLIKKTKTGSVGV